MRAELETALSAASDDVSIEKLRKDFATKEAMIEHNIDSKVHTFSAQISVTYNVSSADLKPRPHASPTHTYHCSPLLAVPLQVNWKSCDVHPLLLLQPPPLLL